MGRITRNYLYNVAYQLLVILTPIITAPYLARVLEADNLGIYGYVNSSGNIITTCSLLGIYAYGNRQTAYVRNNSRKLTESFWEIMYTRVLLGMIGTLVYAVYAFMNREFRIYFILYYPYILAQFIDCTWVFVGLEDMKPAVIKNTTARLLNVMGIFLFVRRRDDLWIYILLLAVTALFTNITAYSQIGKYIGKPTGKFKRIAGHIRDSAYLFLPQVAALLYIQMDKIMLQWLTGMSRQVSFYDNAEKLINIPLSLITVMSTVMMPRIANEFKKKNIEQISKLLNRAGGYSLFAAFPMMFGLASVAKQFIPWYLGSEFAPVANAMIFLSPIVVFNSLTGISGQQYFTATNQIDILLKAYLSAAILNIIVNAMLIPRYGYMGAAAATVGSSLISTILQYYYLNKQIKVNEFIAYGFKYCLASVFMAFVVFQTTYNMQAKVGTTALQILVGISVYLGLLFVVKDKILAEIIVKIRSWVGKRSDR